MKCPHKNCGKEFKEPLELFTGNSVCPYCKKPLTANAELKITAENEELYDISEIYYLRYLSPSSWEGEKKAVFALTPSEMLDNAIENCRLSANRGNPKAVFKMGYYNEHYLETVRSERDRIRTAYNYYASLCFCELKNVPTENGSVKLSDSEFLFLKTRAAQSLIKLYVNHSKELKDSAKFDFEKDRRRIKTVYGNDFVETINDAAEKNDKANKVFSVIKSCLKKERTPLCGLFLLNGAELKKLFSLKSNEKDKKPDLFKAISKGVEIRYLPCDGNGIISSEVEERHFINFSGERKTKELLSNIANDEYLYLYFFNSACKRKFLSARQIKTVEKSFSENHFERVCRLIDFSAGDYLFFEDDLYFYAHGKNARKSAELLVDSICGREL